VKPSAEKDVAMAVKEKYLWFTDTHFDKVLPWTLATFIFHIIKENPKGIFLTGDIANGLLLEYYLKIIATFVKCPIYFVLGNHDYHYSSIEKVHEKVRKLCKKYPNLIWMTDAGVVPLNKDVALIGTEGWYDATNGTPLYLKFTIDWVLIEDFRKLPDINARIAAWRKLADESVSDLTVKLKSALDQNYKNIYVLTHFPPWKEATRDVGTIWERFLLPYNANIRLGDALTDMMGDYKDRDINVFSGHTHEDCWIQVSRNVECKVMKARYYGFIRNEEVIYI
jgi:predicted phosphohydrolase